ncbi:BEM_HP_G0079430.mRNA.1.CDS.1 [Saccharomyces cerevisiae]|nr:BEM_HP_G0079430.mRNA.1.CDS.1 [Saccharomyces cerevisiae]CAI6991320.1 BEM_HP_G0079430.mRNA.1.CDS.1 [Saccharomyces cerevisiae]
MLKTYYDKLNSRDSHISDEITKESMWNVYKLFSLYFIDKHSGEFQQFKIFTPDQISKVVQPQLLALCQL